MWLPVCPFSEVILYSRWRSGVNILSVVRSIEVVHISEVENTLYIICTVDSSWCHRLCPLYYRGCPLLRVSVNRGFTVANCLISDSSKEGCYYLKLAKKIVNRL